MATLSPGSPSPANAPRREGSTSWVYALLSADNRWLYIGVTNDPQRRVNEHRKSKPWWPEVDRVGLMQLPDRLSACAMEAYAIEVFRPLHNVAIEPFYPADVRDVLHLTCIPAAVC